MLSVIIPVLKERALPMRLSILSGAIPVAFSVSAALAAPPLFSVVDQGGDESGTAQNVVAGWEAFTIRGRKAARFSVVDHGGEPVLMAEANAASGGLVYKLKARSEDTGVIGWSWRIANHISGSDIRTRDGDDFPARVYLTFARDAKSLPFTARVKRRLAELFFGQEIPTAALCYVWAETLAEDTVVPNAYSDTVMMWVLENGGPTPSDWRSATRDYRADYLAAFGETAPPLMGIILAIDTDDTGETARSWFGDVSLLKVTSPAD